MPDTAKSTKYTDRESSKIFTKEERAAIAQRAAEQKAETRRSGGKPGKAGGESDVLAKIAEMPESDRALATQVHELIKASAPDLSPKTWYGMPSYATPQGKIVCFYQGAYKFNTRYAMLGFNDSANLDDGRMWPVYFALTEITDTEAATISTLLKKALR
jgi:uncharacterized protein YdhG (YjbR/CyaY superfamily)